jgi:hypothetical protein
MGLVLSAQGTFAQVTTDNPVVLLAHEPDIYVKVQPRVAMSRDLADAAVAKPPQLPCN